ncbi:Uncharacterised protein [Candidatus Norongarragalina meridionalis]|nr:Uncharacterised protein [Candidatus Norongarragalina meridionalis]
MKAFWWFLIAALLLGGWYYWYGGASQLDKYAAESDEMKQTAMVAAYEAQKPVDFVSFTDPYYGFTVKYPVGFVADFGYVGNPRFSAKAAMGENAEVIQADAVELPLSSFSLNPDLGITISNKQTTKIAGKTATVYDAMIDDSLFGRTLYGRWAAIDCALANGTKYTLVITGAVSPSLTSDLRMLDYVIYSATC